MNGRYYWLKLKKDYLKRHDIRILESMENGQLSAFFYLKLMLESVDHEGELRFNEEIPYTPEMLATITDTDVEIVKTSLDRLKALKMIEITQDGTIILEHVKTMIGSAVDNDNARRQSRFRESQKSGTLRKVTADVTKSNESKSKSKSKSKRQSNTYIFVAPSVEEVYEYCQERHNTINPQLFVDYYQSKDWLISNGCKMTDWKAAIRAWENNKINYQKGDEI